ncbi:tail completion protein gp17 [Numidum massiliense]|uniref:tail completion protein gp17 n=1 Tax=Numidum massiliense TaxID=1522315 RepID=UPI0006D552E5|nr:DUF3168 domain-containing protein [Numidum massiliense]
MINMEAPVIDALESDPEVSRLVGEKIFRWTVPDETADKYPYIRVVEIDNVDNDYNDNRAVASDIEIQIDLWTRGDPAQLQTAINRVMKSLSFKRTSVAFFYEEDTGATRKVLRFTTKVTLEE